MSRLLVAVWLVAAAGAAGAEERIADIRQGTNLSVALAPGGSTLVVDLLGQLWSLPAAGGGAAPLTPAGEQARNPRFSPDGGRLVYQQRNGEHWDLWLLEVATGEQHAADDVALRRARAGLHARRPRRRLRDESHRTLLPLVDHARRTVSRPN